MGITDRIVGLVNWFTDQDWVWWPLARLRPERTEPFTSRLALRLSLIVIVPAAAVALILSLLQVAVRDQHVTAIDSTTFASGAAGAFLAVWAAYLALLLLAAVCWNRRAAHLRAGKEVARAKRAEAHEWRSLVVASVIGWAIFKSVRLWFGLAGVVILAIAQWLAVRHRWNVRVSWIALLVFCVSLGVVLGDFVGGSVQNMLDGVSWVSRGVEYLGPDRSVFGYLMGKVVVGAFVGVAFALAQWAAVRSSLARAYGSALINVVGLSIASGAAAVTHAVVQRTLVGVYLQAFLGGMSGAFGWASATTDLIAWGLLVASAALLEGVITGNFMGRSFANYARDVGPGERCVNQRAAKSFVLAVTALSALVLTTLVAQWYPPSASAGKPLSSPGAGMIVIFGLGWMVLGPAALVAGIRALRSTSVREGQETGRRLAWTGVVTGGAVLCLLILALVLYTFFGDFVRTLPGGVH